MAAFVLGTVTYFRVLYRGLSYTERNRMSSTSYLVYAGLVLVLGFFLTLRLKHARYRIATWMIAVACVGQMVVINWDGRLDPTNHNLLPLEFIVLAVVTSPAYLGIALGNALGRLRK